MEIAEGEIHVEIDSARKQNKKKPGKPSDFSACVCESVEKVIKLLRRSEDYQAIFLIDEAMGIDKFAAVCDNAFLTSKQRARYRGQFRQEIEKGAEQICFHIYGKLNEGNTADCLFIWKVPVVNGSQHVGNVAKVINECRAKAPKHMSREAVRHLNSIMDCVSDVPAKVCEVLRNYIFVGDADPDGSIGDEYVQLVMDMAAGEPINESLLSSCVSRPGNSRGGKGSGATMFTKFWDACRQVLLPDSASQERRNSTTIYASAAHSTPNLVKQGTYILQKKVDAGEFETLPAIPSNEWVRLQFVPNNAFKEASSNATG